MNKKIRNIYVKYTVKNPIVFILFIVLGALSVMLLTLNTKVNIYSTCSGQFHEESIIIDKKIEVNGDSIYLYTNKNDSIYKVNVLSVDFNTDKSIIKIKKNPKLTIYENSIIRIDIPVKQITLFQRVFVRGGKS